MVLDDDTLVFNIFYFLIRKRLGSIQKRPSCHCLQVGGKLLFTGHNDSVSGKFGIVKNLNRLWGSQIRCTQWRRND